MRIKKALFLFFILLGCALFSQEAGYLEFSGKCYKEHQTLKGAYIAIYKNGTKVSDLTTGRNGKFQFFLDFGTDFKITFSAPGCADMYMIIYASQCKKEKSIFPIYDMDVNFFPYNNATVNYELFKNPITKVYYDGKKSFQDDEAYVKDFLDKLFVSPDVINKQNEQLALEKEKLEMQAKLKHDAEERERQTQIAQVQQRAQEEAERAKKAAKEQNNKSVTPKSEPTENNSVASEEMQLTIEKEKRALKEKQNKSIRSLYESDLLKIVATNERQEKAAQFAKDKGTSEANEVIETLKKNAEVKAKSQQVVFDSKTRNKQIAINKGVKNKMILSLIKQSAANERKNTFLAIKKYPEVAAYKPAGIIAISSDVEKGTFKTTYTYTLAKGTEKTMYKRENYPWGVNYFYKNEKEISEQDFLKELAQYNIR
ncbi:MAG: hypothetical protein JST67_11655 [Bacteroidetes bacterium]|nr:hypothetical protein [Bacteroidota bacterium]